MLNAARAVKGRSAGLKGTPTLESNVASGYEAGYTGGTRSTRDKTDFSPMKDFALGAAGATPEAISAQNAQQALPELRGVLAKSLSLAGVPGSSVESSARIQQLTQVVGQAQAMLQQLGLDMKHAPGLSAQLNRSMHEVSGMQAQVSAMIDLMRQSMDRQPGDNPFKVGGAAAATTTDVRRVSTAGAQSPATSTPSSAAAAQAAGANSGGGRVT
ncbi:MAG: hypothetical protein AB7P76_12425 [Candidatus Melainabacteria bacterium]